ncbi:MAG: DUF6371 domain-containing protein [Bacteroidota bacterium]
MSQNHRYILQPYKSLSNRYTCPACNEKKKFSRYIDRTNNEQLADDCGRCERSDGCGYHFTPAEFFKENPTNKPLDFEKWQPVPAPPPRHVSYIDKSIFNKTLGVNTTNTFTNFLIALFGKERAELLVNKYHIGTTKSGEAIFYQVDLQGNVRSGKVMKYNVTASDKTALGKDCKRDKTTFPNWVHSKLKLENFNLNQCLFGEHLINENQTIAVVESEKSAVLASVYFPKFVWVACGGKEGLGIEKLKVLKGKNVILFPDLNGFDKWNLKAQEMKAFCKSVAVSDLLEQVATVNERASGLDLADYLLRLPALETMPAVATDTVTEITVIADTHESVTVKNNSLGNLSQSDNNEQKIKPVDCDIVISDLITIQDIPFWEDVAKSDTPLTPLAIRGKLIVEWFVEHSKPFDGTFCMDGIAINDIKSVIVKHIQIIDNGDSAMSQSVKLLERIKKAFTGCD